MELLWIKWAGGIETRDDGYTIYHDIRFAMLRSPNGVMQKFRSVEDAKRSVRKV
jgi:hypothetical protein